MARLSQRGAKHDQERKTIMAMKQKCREKMASMSPDGGGPIKFVHTLSEMEQKDHEAALIIHDEREAKAKRLENERT